MLIRDFLVEKYADLHDLSRRTQTLYHHTLDRFDEFLGHEGTMDDLNDLTVVRFLQWRRDNKDRPVKPTTVLKDRTQLLAIANHAAKKNLLKEFLVLPPFRAAGKLPEAYLEEDVQKLLLAASYLEGRNGVHSRSWWWQSIILLCLETAGRIGEVRALKWREVDLEGCCVVFLAETRKGKTRDIRRGISKTLRDLLAKEQGKANEYVFDWDMPENSIWYRFNSLCEMAKVKQRGFHGFRKTAASIVAAHSGHSHAQKLLDHDRGATTERHYLDNRIVGLAKSVADVIPAFQLSPEPHDTKREQ